MIRLVEGETFEFILNEKEKISIELPENWKLVQKVVPYYYRPKRYIPEVIRSSLENPFGTDKLEVLLKNKKNIVIISDDQTRPTPVYDLLSILIEKLNKCGISNENIKIIVGKGLHPAPNEREIVKKFKDLPKKYEFIIHNPDEKFKLVGTTSSKVPVEVNEIVTDADFVISLGTILPHELTGFSGGAAIIVPGVASRKTIRLNHSLIFKVKENSYFGNLDNNQVRLDMEEAAKLAKLDFIVNIVLDNYGHIFDVFTGDFSKAHKAGSNYFTDHYGINVKEKADISIITSYPRHKTVGKGLKALFISDFVTKDKGTVICFISADNGFSASKAFEELLLKNLKVSELLAMLRKGELPGEACVLYLFTRIKQNKQIIIITKKHLQEKIEKVGLNFAEDFDAAVKLVANEKNKTVHIIPEGINFLPILEKKRLD